MQYSVLQSLFPTISFRVKIWQSVKRNYLFLTVALLKLYVKYAATKKLGIHFFQNKVKFFSIFFSCRNCPKSSKYIPFLFFLIKVFRNTYQLYIY